MTNGTLEAALRYADLGWYLLPILPTGERKHAGSVLGRGWQRKVSRDPRKLRKWFSAGKYNIGGLEGPLSGFIDVESDNPEAEALAREKFNGIRTPKFRSSNSDHYLFKWIPDLERSAVSWIAAGRIPCGLECRLGGTAPNGEPKGVQSLLPPEVHKVRKWVTPPWRCPLADPPDWLIDEILAYSHKPLEHTTPITLPEWVTFTDLYTSAEDFVRTCPPAVSKRLKGPGRDRITYAVACKLVSGYGILKFDAALKLLTIYNARSLPPLPVADLEGKVHNAIAHARDIYWEAIKIFGDETPLERPPQRLKISLASHHEYTAFKRKVLPTGLNLDHAPTGSGKSYADLTALTLMEGAPGMKLSLTVLPTHANCEETVKDMLAMGLEAMAWPKMSPDNCARADEVDELSSVDMPPAMILCPRCPYRQDCRYIEQSALAAKAPHLVVTHRRFALQTRAMTSGRRFISIHEDPRETLAPQFCIPLTILKKTLESLPVIIGRLRDLKLQEDIEYAEALIHLGEQTYKLLEPAPATEIHHATRWDVIPPRRRWLRNVYHLRKKAKVYVSGDTVLALMDLLAGDFWTWALSVSRGRRGCPVRQLVVTQRTRLPKGKIYIIGDATAQPDALAEITGQPVNVVTPVGRLEQLHPITQIPDPVSKSSHGAPVELYVRKILDTYPEVQRLGVISFKNHVKDLFPKDEPGPLGDLKDRISKYTYFGHGLDRGSNCWTTECDLLLIVGTPYVPGSALRAELLRRGQYEAALKVPRRVPGTWLGTDEGGHFIPVATKVFEDETWRRVEDSLVTAALEQAIGRARVILPSGIPVVLVTNRLTDYDVTIQPMTRPNGTVFKLLELVRTAQGPVKTTDLAHAVGTTARHVNRLLHAARADCEKLQQSHGSWAWTSETDICSMIKEY